MTDRCKACGSFAINPHLHGRDSTDTDYCDVCYWRRRSDSLQAQLDERSAEIKRLEKLVYVPGVTKCAKCKFSQISSTFHVGAGKLSADNSPQKCPNGCGPLWRVTERDAGNEMVNRCEEMKAQLEAARAQCQRFRSIMTEIAAECDGGDEFDGDPIPAELWDLYRETPEQSLHEIEARAFMAGQADCGVDPSYSSATDYATRLRHQAKEKSNDNN